MPSSTTPSAITTTEVTTTSSTGCLLFSAPVNSIPFSNNQSHLPFEEVHFRQRPAI